MEIRLGNLKFDDVEKCLGYRLSEDDRKIWNEFHDDNADLSGKDECFHVFDMPKCIVFKGEGAKAAIVKMFTRDKIVAQLGQFAVFHA